MIYLSQDSSPQIVIIPAPARLDLSAAPAMFITGGASRKTYAVSVEDARPVGDYIVSEVTLPEGVERGEYDYTFTAGDRQTVGILRVGEYETEAVEFNNVTLYDQFEN